MTVLYSRGCHWCSCAPMLFLFCRLAISLLLLHNHTSLVINMGKFYDHIPEHLHEFMLRQRLFFVATAPLNGGSVNVSPKANEGAFEVTSTHRVRYADLTGSGNETISHLLEPATDESPWPLSTSKRARPTLFASMARARCLNAPPMLVSIKSGGMSMEESRCLLEYAPSSM